MTMAIILLHMFWGVVFFDACEKQRWWAVAAVVISHLVVSCLVSFAEGRGTGQSGLGGCNGYVHVNAGKKVLLQNTCDSWETYNNVKRKESRRRT